MTKNTSFKKNILILITVILLSGCNVELYSNLTERQANEMLSVLLSNGTDADKKSLGKGMYAILVPKAHLASAVELLNARGLPREQYADLKEMYKKEGLISSPMEERIRYMYSLSQSIAETLTNIDGVLVARVHVAVPETDKFSGEIRPTSASVFIKHQDGFDLQGARPEIKKIVESSIEGLAYEKIAVYLSPSYVKPEVVDENKIMKVGVFQIEESSFNLVKWVVSIGSTVFIIMLVCIVWLCSKLGKTIKIANINTSLFAPLVTKMLGKMSDRKALSKPSA